MRPNVARGGSAFHLRAVNHVLYWHLADILFAELDVSM